MLFGVVPTSVVEWLIPTFQDQWYFLILKATAWMFVIWLPVYNKLTSKVMAGHEALRVHNGTPSVYKFGIRKNHPIVYSSGRPPQLPFYHELWQINVQERTLDLEEQNREKVDGVTFEKVRTALVWKVIHTDMALLKPEILANMIGMYGASYLRTLVKDQNMSDAEIQTQLPAYHQYIEKLKELQKQNPKAVLELPSGLKDARIFADKASRLGVEVLEVQVISSNRTDPSQLGAAMRGASNFEFLVASMKETEGGEGKQLDDVPLP